MDFVYLVCCDWWDNLVQDSRLFQVKGIFSTKEKALEFLHSIVNERENKLNRDFSVCDFQKKIYGSEIVFMSRYGEGFRFYICKEKLDGKINIPKSKPLPLLHTDFYTPLNGRNRPSVEKGFKMGKLVKAATIGFVIWAYGKANRAIGYALGTIDTLGEADVQTYEKDFGDFSIRLTKTGNKEA